MKTVAICLARMGSTRFPGKVMKDLGGKPLLRWTVDALRQSSLIDEVVLATSTLPADDIIADYCIAEGICCSRGSESDVLDRFYQAAKEYKADIVLRFTCDCPFIDPHIVNEVIKLREKTGADYASNCYPPTFADGLDTECFKFAVLATAWVEADNRIDRDCLTQFIVRNGSRFKAVNLSNPIPGGHNEHWVCDSADDFKFCSEVAARINRLGRTGGASHTEIMDILDKEPELRNINSLSIRNERFYDALSEERYTPRTFARSRRVFERASKVIPTGANTFSKSHLQFPSEGSPLYASHGDGAYIFDVDGNRYVDLVNALLPCILGYRDPDVDFAIRQQLDNGIVLSLATEMEVELAETLCRLIPCAEMVKFGKTGTDVTTAAVRLARAYTKRNMVFVGGYHGWGDWSMIITDRVGGINHTTWPDSQKAKAWQPWTEDPFPYPDKVAAYVVEPDTPDHLEWLREYCTKHGIVLIFDEIRTGFRYDLGGAQKLYDITPDLACFGKAMANGMPISALVGKREIMKLMETPDVYYSGTFFGETLSIAAALATIRKLEAEDVPGRLMADGIKLEYEILKLREKYGLTDIISLDGWYTNQSVVFKGEYADRLRTLFMQRMFQHGVLIINSNNLSYAMKEPELKRVVTAYDNTFADLRLALDNGVIKDIKPTAAAPLRVVA